MVNRKKKDQFLKKSIFFIASNKIIHPNLGSNNSEFSRKLYRNIQKYFIRTFWNFLFDKDKKMKNRCTVSEIYVSHIYCLIVIDVAIQICVTTTNAAAVMNS